MSRVLLMRHSLSVYISGLNEGFVRTEITPVNARQRQWEQVAAYRMRICKLRRNTLSRSPSSCSSR